MRTLQIQPGHLVSSTRNLTLIVAVNMMGSGIIMLPANMAQVGAISLLSWLVTAVGSMAIAYGFAQAGVFDRKAGGMPAYAEESHGRSGSFMVSYLYYISLAVANVAIGISAIGYLVPFFPWLASTPIATTIGVIVLKAPSPAMPAKGGTTARKPGMKRLNSIPQVPYF